MGTLFTVLFNSIPRSLWSAVIPSRGIKAALKINPAFKVNAHVRPNFLAIGYCWSLL